MCAQSHYRESYTLPPEWLWVHNPACTDMSTQSHSNNPTHTAWAIRPTHTAWAYNPTHTAWAYNPTHTAWANSLTHTDMGIQSQSRPHWHEQMVPLTLTRAYSPAHTDWAYTLTEHQSHSHRSRVVPFIGFEFSSKILVKCRESFLRKKKSLLSAKKEPEYLHLTLRQPTAFPLEINYFSYNYKVGIQRAVMRI